MRKARISKVIMTAISIAAFLVPIILGLSGNEWNAQVSFKPHYVPPKVGFEMGQPNVMSMGGGLILSFQATNTGEVKLSILSMDVTAYGPDGAELGKPKLAQPITLSKGESKTLALNLSLSDQALQKIMLYLNQSGQATIFIRGEAQVKVFSSIVEAPFLTSFIISAADLIKP